MVNVRKASSSLRHRARSQLLSNLLILMAMRMNARARFPYQAALSALLQNGILRLSKTILVRGDQMTQTTPASRSAMVEEDSAKYSRSYKRCIEQPKQRIEPLKPSMNASKVTSSAFKMPTKTFKMTTETLWITAITFNS